MKKISPFYIKIGKGKVKCLVCGRGCVISQGEKGYCRTRINEGGQLYTLIYGEVSTIHLSPIEIKPLYHFFPGTYFLSLGSLGCNFLCPGCQNWSIAHRDAERGINKGETKYFSPQEVVDIALKKGAQGISFTYNEPTLWVEYTMDVFKMAKKKGLATNYVTNGYITNKLLEIIAPYLDSFRVDIKGFSEKTYYRLAKIKNFQLILENCILAKRKFHIHVEIVTNIIPSFNDKEEELSALASWIVEKLGKDTPWHVTRFFPHLYLSHLPSTPLSTLLKAVEIGKSAGLQFVYLGNVTGSSLQNTYCPECGELLLERNNFTLVKNRLRNKSCPNCGREIPVII